MKTIFSFITTAFLILAGNAFADEFRMEDISISPGETKLISLELVNPCQSYIAFEFYLTLPDGVSIALDEDDNLNVELNAARCPRHVLDVVQNADGSYHFLCYSVRNNAFKGVDGEILSMMLKADSSLERCEMLGSIYNQKLSDTNDNKVTFDDYTFRVNIERETPDYVTIVVPQDGVTTYCSNYDLDFTGVTDFKAFVASSYNSTDAIVKMEQVDDTQAGLGLLIIGKPGSYIVPCKVAKNYHTNLLSGTLYSISMPNINNDKVLLTLSIKGETPSFTPTNGLVIMDGHKAWLEIPLSLYDGQNVSISMKGASVNGDLNKDGVVSVSDVTVLVDLILSN